METVAAGRGPYLKPWWRITHEASRVSFHYGSDTIVFEGKDAVATLPRLIRLLDGRRSAADVLAAFAPAAQAAVHEALALFARHEMLLDGPPVDDPRADVRDALHFVAATQPSPHAPADDAAALARLRVGIAGSSQVAEELGRIMARLGTAVTPVGWDGAGAAEAGGCDVVVVAPAAQELPRLLDWNARALAAGTIWLQVLPYDGTFAAVGPLYVPGETGCYECFLHRRAATVANATGFWAMQAAPAPYPAALPADVMLAGLTALALLRWHLRADAALPGAFTALAVGGEVGLSAHTVYRVPRCGACAAAAPVPAWFEGAGAWNG